MSDLARAFATAIRSELTRRGMSQREFAQVLGVSNTLVVRVLGTAANPNLETVERFASALDLDLKITARRRPQAK
jgi:transcriptional regulator with XRE-family HTH domain